MGSAPMSALFQTENESDQDTAHEIASTSNVRKISAMRIGIDPESKELVFLGEVRVFQSNKGREARYAKGLPWEWLRLEVKSRVILKKEQTNLSICSGEQIVIAQYPYYTCIVQRATFKPRIKGKYVNQLSQTPMATPDDLLKYIDKDAKCEEWEQGKWLTAATSKPGKSQRLERMRRSWFKERSVFGVCKNFEEFYNLLDRCEYVKKLLHTTEENTIRFWPSKYLKEKRPKLQDTVIQERLMLMKISIEQALAGPQKKSEYWMGKPVSKLVGRIYRGHLWRRYRSVNSHSKKERIQADPETYARQQARESVFDSK